MSEPDEKAALRRVMETQRAVAKAQSPNAPLRLRDYFLKNIEAPHGHIVASYRAYGGEMDPTPLAEALRAQGCVICLPIVTEASTLTFRVHDPAIPLIAGYRGIPEPPPACPVVEPDILLVPLLAFDGALRRLGRGGGYYDRTLFALRARRKVLAVGLAYACQEVAEVPHRPHDAKLDKVVTEIQVF
ncbi:MAG: 5-formyltetrahydrofolate cyclo-ligase [Alphaproteobacteria bacterium]|nr:5-formyltetrahydrofolate cyclo-ligase [Alphaproteobacteria bacterium]